VAILLDMQKMWAYVKLISGAGLEIEGEATWNRTPKRQAFSYIEEYMQCPWETGFESYFVHGVHGRAGGDYSISPTRTPWASWMGPSNRIDQDAHIFGAGSIKEINFNMWCLWIDDGNLLRFAFYCENGSVQKGFTLPDIQKDNPQ
jgi:hypothetical protein